MVISEIIIGGIIALVLFVLLANRGQNAKSIKNRLDKAARDANEVVRDPVADGQAAIASAKRQLEALREQRRKLFQNNKLIEVSRDKHLENVEKYEKLAVQEGKLVAVDSANSEQHKTNVITLLASKKKAKGLADGIQVEIAKNDTLDAQLKIQIDRLAERIEHATAASNNQEASLRFANLRRDIAAAAAGGTDVDAALDRLEQDVISAQAQAESYEAEAGEQTDLAATLTLKHAEQIPDDELAQYFTLPEKAEVTSA